MIRNHCEEEILLKMNIDLSICKLLMSSIESDVLIGLELCSDKDNFDIIKSYCIGNTNYMFYGTNLLDFWKTRGRHIWNRNKKLFNSSIEF